MTEWQPTRRGVKDFLAQLDADKEYYTIHTAVYPWGNERVWRSWEFEHRKGLLGGGWWAGAVSAEGALRRFGPIYDEKPGGHIRPMFECDDDQLYATPADVLKALKSLREKTSR